MSMENVIKEKTEEIVLKYKLAMKANGGEFSGLYEDLLRQGISYGISFAAMALSSTPVDITFATEDRDEEKMKTLPTMEEYIKLHLDDITSLTGEKYSEPLFECPACGGNVCRNETLICASNPPKMRYDCMNCGRTIYI